MKWSFIEYLASLFTTLYEYFSENSKGVWAPNDVYKIFIVSFEFMENKIFLAVYIVCKEQTYYSSAFCNIKLRDSKEIYAKGEEKNCFLKILSFVPWIQAIYHF